jgi:hypothetical protein
MRAVTFIASAAAESGYRVMFEDEWSRLVCVASHALALERGLAYDRGLRRVCRMAIAADKLPFRHWVMEVQSEFSYLWLVALATQRYFIRLKHHLLFRLLRGADKVTWILRLAALESASLQCKLRIRVQLMTSHTSQIGLGVFRVLPVRAVHRLSVAP